MESLDDISYLKNVLRYIKREEKRKSNESEEPGRVDRF